MESLSNWLYTNLRRFLYTDEEEKNVSQSSDFDFDEVDEMFLKKMQDNAAQNRIGNDDVTREESETGEQGTSNETEENDMNIIDLTSEPEVDTAEGCPASISTDLQSDSKMHETSRIKLHSGSIKSQESAKPDEDQNSDSAPSLLSAEDLSKLAAQNPTVADEPPVLTKMSPTCRVSNSLENMISRLKTRVLTTQPSSSDSSLNGADGPAPMDFEQSVGDVLDKRPTEKSPASVEHPLGMTVEPISDPSSPDTENIESYPPSPSSFRSDVSKTESLDPKSEVSTGSSRRSSGVSSKPPAKKLKSKWRHCGQLSQSVRVGAFPDFVSQKDVCSQKLLVIMCFKGLFTLKEEDPRRRNNFFVCFTCRIFGRSGYQVEKEKKNNCRPLAAERPAAAMFVLFVPSTTIF